MQNSMNVSREELWQAYNNALELLAKLHSELAELKTQLQKAEATPNTSLPPLGDPPRRKMLIEIEVSADFENRLDNQWMVEREINADRWSWSWASVEGS